MTCRSLLFFVFLFLLPVVQAQRVVSLSPALTELVCYLGASEKLVGRSSACNEPPNVKKLPIAGQFGMPNLEKIIRLKADLVLSNDFIQPLMAKKMRSMGIQVELHQCRDLTDYREWVTKLGTLLEVPQKAKNEIQKLDSFLQEFKTPKNPKKVLWVIWDKPLMIAGNTSFLSEVIQYSGGENCCKNVQAPYFKCSYDWLLQHPPDVIIWSATQIEWQKNNFWKKMSAVQQGHVIIPENPDLLLRPGPRIFTGINLLKQRLQKM